MSCRARKMHFFEFLIKQRCRCLYGHYTIVLNPRIWSSEWLYKSLSSSAHIQQRFIQLSPWWSSPVFCYWSPLTLSISSKVCGYEDTIQTCRVFHTPTSLNYHSMTTKHLGNNNLTNRSTVPLIGGDA